MKWETNNPDELLKDMRFDAHWLNRSWNVVEQRDGKIVQSMTTDQMLAFVNTAARFAARFQRLDTLGREGKLPSGWAVSEDARVDVELNRMAKLLGREES